MTGVRLERRRGRPTLAAGLLVLFTLLPPLPAGAADEDELTLPFLRADGVVRAVPPAMPVLLPVWTSAVLYDDDRGGGVAPVRIDRRGQEERHQPPGRDYPDARDLLRAVPGVSHVEDGRVEFAGDDEQRARLARLLGAVRVGFDRRVLIEVEVRRAAEERIALRGEAPLGALLVADAREGHDYPAGLDLEPNSACAEMMCVQVGSMVVASAVRADELLVLRLAVHTSKVAGDVRFEGDGLTLVAPALTFTSLLVEVPAGPNERGTVRYGDLTVTYRVTPRPSAAAPAGTRVFSLDAASSLFGTLPLPEPGLVPREERQDGTGLTMWHDPPAWTRAAEARVGRFDVQPGLVVLEGDEAALQAATARWRDAWHTRRTPVHVGVALEDGVRLEAPLVSPARLALVTGRLDPVVRRIRPAIATSVVEAGPVLSELFTGRTLTVTFENGRSPRLTETRADAVDTPRTVIPIVVREHGVERREEQSGSRWAPEIHRTSRMLRPDEIGAWREDR